MTNRGGSSLEIFSAIVKYKTPRPINSHNPPVLYCDRDNYLLAFDSKAGKAGQMDPYQRTLPGQVIKLLPNPLSRIGLVLFLLVLISSCSQDPKEYGVVEGQVNIGPLQPVVREGEDSPTLAPEVYEAREIVVYKKDGRTEYTRLGINPTG